MFKRNKFLWKKKRLLQCKVQIKKKGKVDIMDFWEQKEIFLNAESW